MNEDTQLPWKKQISRFENYTCLFYALILPVWMLLMLFLRVDYNPLLLFGEQYHEILNSNYYDDVATSWLFGLLFLLVNTAFTSFTLLSYGFKGNPRRTRNFLRVILVSTVFEFYFRDLQVLFNNHPFGDEVFGYFLGGLFKYVLYIGILVLFYFKVANRVADSGESLLETLKDLKSKIPAGATGSSSLEKQLIDLKSLRDKDLITEEEYSAKRSSILS